MTKGIRVFIVEDEEAILHILEEELTESGFSIVTAGSGEEAIRMLELEASSYKALITDVNLSGDVTGWDVGKYAREMNDRIAVVYMTGASAHDWASRGVPNSLLMLKPFAVAQAVTAVAQLVNAAAILL